MKQLKIIFLFLFVVLTVKIQAQGVINAGGTNTSGSNGTVSLSIGQFVYNNYSGTNGNVIEGVQQPYEISVISGIKDVQAVSLSYDLYPNPASEFIFLKLRDANLLANSTLMYQLIDINGKVIQADRISDLSTRVCMKNLKSSTYFLRIIQSNAEKVTYKIIKN